MHETDTTVEELVEQRTERLRAEATSLREAWEGLRRQMREAHEVLTRHGVPPSQGLAGRVEMLVHQRDEARKQSVPVSESERALRVALEELRQRAESIPAEWPEVEAKLVRAHEGLNGLLRENERLRKALGYSTP